MVEAGQFSGAQLRQHQVGERRPYLQEKLIDGRRVREGSVAERYDVTAEKLVVEFRGRGGVGHAQFAVVHAGIKPVSETAITVRPVDGVAADGAGYGAVDADCRIDSLARVQLRLRSRQELADVLHATRVVHPWQPRAQVIAVPFDQCKDRLS